MAVERQLLRADLLVDYYMRLLDQHLLRNIEDGFAESTKPSAVPERVGR